MEKMKNFDILLKSSSSLMEALRLSTPGLLTNNRTISFNISYSESNFRKSLKNFFDLNNQIHGMMKFLRDGLWENSIHAAHVQARCP